MENPDPILRAIHRSSEITLAQLHQLLDPGLDPEPLFGAARGVSQAVYGNRVFIRGLIEFTNHCRNDCYYCGIRRSNLGLSRYRLTEEEILERCRLGYDLGFRTFVLQGGEDPWFTDEKICTILSDLRRAFPDCALTLSIGEKPRESYFRYRQAGADRYLLRHETADPNHYTLLHPKTQTLDERFRCLYDLKDAGFQVGCGFMVGSPGQTLETLHKDLQFIARFKPHMVGIGPFIPQKDTPFANEPAGTLEVTLRLLSVIRLLHPSVLLPATTALGSIHPQGRELGILAGANVVMPNLSPPATRDKYRLYDNKLSTGCESAEGLQALRARLAAIGYEIPVERGDAPPLAERPGNG